MAPIASRDPSLGVGEMILTTVGRVVLRLSNPNALSIIGVILPILTHPFMPSDSSGNKSGGAMALFFFTYIFQILYHLFFQLCCLLGKSCIQVPSWVIPVLFCGLLVCGAGDPRAQEEQQTKFTLAATWIFFVFLYYLVRLATGPLFAGLDPPPYHVGCTFALVVSILIIAGAVFTHFSNLATSVFYHFALRRVRWWTWLPENGAKDDFEPPWSSTLVSLMIIWTVILPALIIFSAGAD